MKTNDAVLYVQRAIGGFGVAAIFLFGPLIGYAANYNSGNPTAEEQYVLELINRARANPGVEATRLGMGLNDGIPAGSITNTPKPPLAMNANLLASARNHTAWMIANNIFSHTGSGGSDEQQRMTDAGYVFSGTYGLAENISWTSQSLPAGATACYEGLFRSILGHRQNTFSMFSDEIGIGIQQGAFQGYGSSTVLTENFAYSASTALPFIVGVVYRDNNLNSFYDIGEGVSGVTVTASGTTNSAVTGTAGGYAIPVPANISYTVTFTVPGSNAVQKNVSVGTVNVKLDHIATSNPTETRIIGLSGDLSFGTVNAGSTAYRTLTISNTGNSALSVSGIIYPSGFSGAWSGNIPVGQSQNVTVAFSPAAAVSYGGTVSVNSNATSGTNTRSISGTGSAPPTDTRIIGLSGDLSFGTVNVGSTAYRTLTISNTGNSALSVSGIIYPSGFSGAWSGNIPAGQSQNVTVAFSPAAAVSYGGTVSVNSNATSGTGTRSISGTGTGGGGSAVTLARAQTVTSLSGAQWSQKYYVLPVPSGYNYVYFETWNGTGDVDIYGRKDYLPTTSTYDISSTTNSNSEGVGFDDEGYGDYYLLLYGYQAYSGVSLYASYGYCRPDAGISTGASLYGRYIYNTTGGYQWVVAKAPPKRSKTYYFYVFNNGDTSESFVLDGYQSSSKCRVNYVSVRQANGTVTYGVNSAVSAGTFVSDPVPPGGHILLTLTMRGNSTARIGSRFTNKITVKSDLVPSVADTAIAYLQIK